MRFKTITLLTISISLFVQTVFSQSKKEQIEILNNRIDSLNRVVIYQEAELKANQSHFLSVEEQLKENKQSLEKKTIDEENCRRINLEKDNALKKKSNEIEELKIQLSIKNDSISSMQIALHSLSKVEDIQSTNSVNKLDPDKLPNRIKEGADACLDCYWYIEDSNEEEIGQLLFVHLINSDHLYFLFNGKEVEIPLKSRKFTEAYTETEQPIGSGILIFENDEFRVLYSFSKAGHSIGNEGELELFRFGEKIQTFSIRAF